MVARPMRIMLVVNEYPPQKVAGTAIATQALAQMLSRRGYAVHVVVTTPCRSVDGVESLCVSSIPDRPFKGVGIFWRLWHVWRFVRRWQPDILQGQSVSCGLLTAVVGKLLNIPNITYAQGQDVYQSTVLQKLTEIRIACRWATVVATVTRQLSLRVESIKASDKASVIPHGFTRMSVPHSRDDFRREKGIAGRQKVVLNVGRLEPIKGQDILLAAWPIVLKQEPDTVLWLVGDGSMREQLAQQVSLLDVDASVKFFGAAEAVAVAAYMSSSDVFVLPSRSEAFGIVLLEAMDRGLPVVATKVGGVPEVLPEHGAISLVAPGDAVELASAIVRQLQCSQYPVKANREWATDFVWEKNVLRFEKIYREIVR